MQQDSNLQPALGNAGCFNPHGILISHPCTALTIELCIHFTAGLADDGEKNNNLLDYV